MRVKPRRSRKPLHHLGGEEGEERSIHYAHDRMSDALTMGKAPGPIFLQKVP